MKGKGENYTMKTRPKNAKSAALIFVGVFAIMALFYFLGIGPVRSAMRIGYIGNEGWRSWSASYELLSGSLQHTIHPNASSDTMHIDVTTKSGSISIEVKSTDGTVVFFEKNIGSDSFDIKISEKVTVLIKAQMHKGSFNISSE